MPNKRNNAAKRLAQAAAGLVLSAGLTACGTVQIFGIDRSTPDEFAVVSRAPLTLPPDYELRPPQPGVPRPQEGSTSDQVSQILAGGAIGSATVSSGNDAIVSGASASAPLSLGEQTLLADLGADQADPDIRSIVDAESSALYRADDRFLDRLLFWKDPEPDGQIVNPSGEARRIAANEASGRAVNEGPVPIIERRRRAPLEGIFN